MVKEQKLAAEINGTENRYRALRINYHPKLVLCKDEPQRQTPKQDWARRKEENVNNIRSQKEVIATGIQMLQEIVREC